METGRMSQRECMASCHSMPGELPGKMSDMQHQALISGTLSSMGAAIAGFGCAGTGISCGLASVLGADAMRQFNRAGTGTDPVVRISIYAGATERQAVNNALFADIMTATFSIHGAYKGLFIRSTQTFTAGTIGATHTDLISTAHTVNTLQNSLEKPE